MEGTSYKKAARHSTLSGVNNLLVLVKYIEVSQYLIQWLMQAPVFSVVWVTLSQVFYSLLQFENHSLRQLISGLSLLKLQTNI